MSVSPRSGGGVKALRKSPALTGSVVPLFFSVCAAGVAATSTSARGAIPSASIALMFLLVGLGIGVRQAGKSETFTLRLMPVVLFWWSIAFGLASATWWWDQVGTPAQIQREFVIRALALMALGSIVMVAGYRWAGKRAGSFVGRPIHSFVDGRSPITRSWASPLVLYGLSLIGKIALLATTGGIGYLASTDATAGPATQIFSVLAQCGPIALLVAGQQVWHDRRPQALFSLMVVLAAEMGYALVSGVKEDLVVVGLALLLPWMTARKRVPVFFIATGLFLFIFVLTPFNQNYRELVRGNDVQVSTGQAFSIAPSVLAKTLTGVVDPGNRSEAQTSAFQRVREIDNVAIILQRTPSQVPYRSASDLLMAPLTAIVPRAVWSGKPVLDGGYRFSQEYYRLPPSMKTSSAVTTPGDLYRHGGLIMFVVGMAGLGLAIRMVDNVLSAGTTAPLAILFLILSPLVGKAEIEAVAILASIPSALVLWLLAVTVTYPKKGTSS